jgi:D-alanine-D-alanine ligase
MRNQSLQIGIVFETFGSYPRGERDPVDSAAEYEPESTIALLESAVLRMGHAPVRLGTPLELLAGLSLGKAPGIDAALNIAEGYGSRNREAWAPVLLEMVGVPTLGSDALTLSTSLDKAWASRAVAAAGVPVAAQRQVPDARSARALDLSESGLAYPLFVKPRWEGSAKGIRVSSRVLDRESLVREVARIVRDYDQPALVEAFLPGAEYTVAIVGNDPPRVLPVLQRALEQETRIGAHALAHGSPESNPELCLPGTLDAALETELSRLALQAWNALECLDFARVDFRLDAGGQPRFLEINPLPTFAVDGTFAIQAELAGRDLDVFVADILATGLQRLGLPQRVAQPARVVGQ